MLNKLETRVYFDMRPPCSHNHYAKKRTSHCELIVAPCHINSQTRSQVGHLWTPKLKRQMQTVDKKANIFQTTTLLESTNTTV